MRHSSRPACRSRSRHGGTRSIRSSRVRFEGEATATVESCHMSLIRSIAERITVHAQSLLPADKREWGAAMRAEMDHIDGHLRALRWSMGCALVCYIERYRTMNRSHAQV